MIKYDEVKCLNPGDLFKINFSPSYSGEFLYILDINSLKLSETMLLTHSLSYTAAKTRSLICCLVEKIDLSRKKESEEKIRSVISSTNLNVDFKYESLLTLISVYNEDSDERITENSLLLVYTVLNACDLKERHCSVFIEFVSKDDYYTGSYSNQMTITRL